MLIINKMKSKLDQLHEAISLDDDINAEQILQRFGWRWFWFGYFTSTLTFLIPYLIIKLWK